MYPDEFHVDINYRANIDDENFLKKYQIIHFHRTFGPYEHMEKRMGRLRQMGIKTVLDIDDYWSPSTDHPAYMLIKGEELDKKIMNNLPLADYVMTTTPIFATEISKFNKNVVIIPNAIDINEKQYQPEQLEKYTDRVRVGWLGGSSHMSDLELLNSSIGKLIGDGLDNKLQFVVCGFDVRGEITEINPQTQEKKKRKIRPEETIWVKYEEIFTNKYGTIKDPNYVKFLKSYENEDYNDFDQPYRRVWTKPITTYAKNYNLFDISLAPIKEHTFNRVKSQLKVIEAAFHKKCLIAQEYGPYTIDLKNAYDNGQFIKGGNSLLVPSVKNHKMWYKHIKLLINNPNFITDISEQLNYDIVPKYNLNKVTTDRAEFYRSIL